MNKKVFKNNIGDFHFGANAPAGYSEAAKEELVQALKNLGGKKLWRCNVCNDLQINDEPPEECPTCFTKNAYVEIEVLEFEKILAVL